MLEYFENNGGRIVDTALNYGVANEIIKEYGWKHKIITKIRECDEFYISLERLDKGKVHCIMARKNDESLINYLHDKKKSGYIENVGLSIYYPHEINQNVNMFHIPAAYYFLDYMETMTLHASVIVRSLFNISKEKDDKIETVKDTIKMFKDYDRKDLNHFVDFCIGCDNLDQLKEDMELCNIK